MIKRRTYSGDTGFTVVELMIAMVISSVVLAVVFMTFKSQHDSYLVQDQVTVTQQNLRSAMDMLKRDIQMAGYYTNYDRFKFTMDWDDLDNDANEATGTENVRPLIRAGNNVNDGNGGDNILDNTDIIVIAKADPDLSYVLQAGDSGGGTSLSLGVYNGASGYDLDADGVTDLSDTVNRFGILVKQDLGAAELFEITSSAANPAVITSLIENYSENDIVLPVDVIIYKLNDNHTLVRRNLRDNIGYQDIAENIEDLQFQYEDGNGNIVDDPATFTNGEADIRAVHVFLLARTDRESPDYVDNKTYVIGDVISTPASRRGNNISNNFRRKVLASVIKTRNIGL